MRRFGQACGLLAMSVTLCCIARSATGELTFRGLKAEEARTPTHAAVGAWGDHDHTSFVNPHGAPKHPPTKKTSYIVFLKAPSVLDYTGGHYLPPTTLAPGQRFDPFHPHVQAYTAHLHNRKLSMVREVGLHHGGPGSTDGADGTLIHSYGVGFNGFAARLTKEQAKYLEEHEEVAAVEEDRLLKVTTVQTPNMLKLDLPKEGIWDQLGGVLKSGEDMVVGVVDFGILPEHVSFADRGDDGVGGYKPLPGWKYNCTFGGKKGNKCGEKVVICKSFRKGWLAQFGKESIPFTDDTCRDTEVARHGSHVASTAAGNHRTFTQLYGAPKVSFGRMSGVAPRARLAIYRACWGREDFDDEGCATSDIVAAIEAAIVDGVDVINLSLGGFSPEPLITNNPVARAVFLAAAKGIFVAAAAGNEGPSLSSVINIQPWVTTVGNANVDRKLQGVLKLGNGNQYAGRVWWRGVGSAPVILGSRALNASFQPPPQLGFTALEAASVCFNGSLDASKVKGKIVLCENAGEYELKPRYPAYVYMGEVVKNAGGVGFVLLNTGENDMDSITGYYRLPFIQLSSRWLEVVKSYASQRNATARISSVRIRAGTRTRAPTVFITSSKGPLPDFHVLKPDLLAPGTDILAASPPPAGTSADISSSRHSTAFLTGTSMASPHIAGLGALLKQLHPSWSPMAIRSALVTTGDQIDNKGQQIEGDVYSIGGGHVNPLRAADPGLVYDSTPKDWDRYLCAQDFTPVLHSCKDACRGGCGHPASLNSPSIAINRLFGQLTITRRVTNVAKKTSTYTSYIQGLAGMQVTVSPSTLTLKPGQTCGFKITFNPANAAPKDYVTGALTWTDGAHYVRSPIVIDTIQTIAPKRVDFSNVLTKPASYVIQSTSAKITAFSYQPAPVVVQQRKVLLNNSPIQWGAIPVPANTLVVRMRVSSPNPNASPFFRAFLQQNDGSATWQQGSADGFNDPTEDYLINPAAQNLTVFVQAAGKKSGSEKQQAAVELEYWIITADLGTNPPQMTASVTRVKGVGGERYNATVTLGFSGLRKGKEYTGLVFQQAPAVSTNVAAPTEATLVVFTP